MESGSKSRDLSARIRPGASIDRVNEIRNVHRPFPFEVSRKYAHIDIRSAVSFFFILVYFLLTRICKKKILSESEGEL